MPEEFEPMGDDGLSEPPSFFPQDEEAPADRPVGPGELVEAQIEGVFQSDGTGHIARFVLLSNGAQRIPIMIGPFEAKAILDPLESTRPDRPMTHDLLKNVIDRLGAEVDRIVIDDLWNGTYYAKIYLTSPESEGHEMEIDARPSDAIALAIRADAPLYVNSNVFDAAALENDL